MTASHVLSLGFAPIDLLKIYGIEVSGCLAFSRITALGAHQYVTLSHYDGRFVEGCYEAYQERKDTRSKTQEAVDRALFREWAELGAILDDERWLRCLDVMRAKSKSRTIPLDTRHQRP